MQAPVGLTVPDPALLRRIQAEFREMPGLQLTVPQAQRLWGLDRRTAEVILDTLLADGLLARSADGAFLRRHDY